MNTELSKIIDLINQSHYQKAIKLIDRELKNDINSFVLNKTKATALFLQKNYNKALVHFNKCYEINPKDYDVNVNISYIFNMVQDFKSSLKFCEDALKVNKNRPEVYHNMAHCYLYIPELEKAEQLVLKSIELRGGLATDEILNVPDTLNLYADILLAKGDLNKFNEVSKNILNKNVFFGDMFRQVLRNNPNSITDDYLNLIRTASNQIVDNKNFVQGTLSKASAYSCLAEYYQKIDKNVSEDYYTKSNQLVSSVHSTSLYSYQDSVKKIKNFFDKVDTKKMSEEIPKDRGNGLIFIIGMPRSGTTLLESIIATDDDCIPGGERLFFVNQCEPIINGKHTSPLEENFFLRLGQGYLDIIDIQRKDKKFYVDKLPGNYLYYKFIKTSLPGAKFIHISRDPWDNATSIYKQNFQDALFWSSSFFGIALQYANYEHIMKHWKKEEDCQDIFDLKYEDLVSNTEDCIDKIWNFCNLTGKYEENKRKKHFAQTASKFQVTQNIYNSSLEKKEFESHKEEFLKNLELQRNYWNSI